MSEADIHITVNGAPLTTHLGIEKADEIEQNRKDEISEVSRLEPRITHQPFFLRGNGKPKREMTPRIKPELWQSQRALVRRLLIDAGKAGLTYADIFSHEGVVLNRAQVYRIASELKCRSEKRVYQGVRWLVYDPQPEPPAPPKPAPAPPAAPIIGTIHPIPYPGTLRAATAEAVSKLIRLTRRQLRVLKKFQAFLGLPPPDPSALAPASSSKRARRRPRAIPRIRRIRAREAARARRGRAR